VLAGCRTGAERAGDDLASRRDPPGAGPDEPVDRRGSLALEVLDVGAGEPEVLGRGGLDSRGRGHRAGRTAGLQPGGEVDGVAPQVEGEAPGSDHPGDDLSAVHADADPVVGAELAVHPGHGMENVKGERAPADRMVVPWLGNAHGGHVPVADGLDLLGAVRPDKVVEDTHDRVQLGNDGLGVHLMGVRGEADEVGEQDGAVVVARRDHGGTLTEPLDDARRQDVAQQRLAPSVLPLQPRREHGNARRYERHAEHEYPGDDHDRQRQRRLVTPGAQAALPRGQHHCHRQVRPGHERCLTSTEHKDGGDGRDRPPQQRTAGPQPAAEHHVCRHRRRQHRPELEGGRPPLGTRSFEEHQTGGGDPSGGEHDPAQHRLTERYVEDRDDGEEDRGHDRVGKR